jgi:Icc-related predicted phosphoesterase
MRAIMASDIHYRLPALDWLTAAADDFDAVILAGDLLNIASPVAIEAQIVVLDSYLARMAERTTLLVSSGNHDLDGPGSHGEQVASWLRRPRGAHVYADGQSVELDAGRVTICPWWDGPATRALVDEQLRAAAVDRPPWWMWIYHSPPAGTPLCDDGHHQFPDQDLADWIATYEPTIVMCGHIHQAPWARNGSWYARLGRTWVFNPGQLRSAVPSHIVLDTDAMTATWYGSPDQDPEVVELEGWPAAVS